MTTGPEILPDDWFGLAGLVIFFLGSAGLRALFRDGEKKTKAATDTTTELLDWFNSRFSELRCEMEEGFAARDKRIDELEQRDEQRAAYDSWLASQALPRPPFLTFVEWIAQHKK